MSPADTPKRILYVENGIGYGGAVICLRHLARNLDKKEFFGRIITGRTGPEYRTIPADADWRCISDRRFDVMEYRRRLESAKWVSAVPGLRWFLNQILARGDDLGNFLPFFVGLWQEIRKFRPDIIHANNEPVCNRAALILGRLMKIPTVCHVRGPLGRSNLAAMMYRVPDHFIPVSRWIDQGIDAIGIPPEKRTVIYDGIELGRLRLAGDGHEFREKYHIGRGDFAVGLVGLLIPWKGQRLFLESALQLRDKIPNLKMLMVGGTPQECEAYEAELRQAVSTQGLDDWVIFTGHVDDMPTVYNALDIVVSASVNPEPLGTVVIEAMAMGRPLIAPNHGGGAEMNVQGETALLFEPGSSESLTSSILRIYQEKELGGRLGAAAMERAYRTFDVATHVEKVQEVYRELLAETRSDVRAIPSETGREHGISEQNS